MSVLPFVLAAMSSLVSNTDHSELGGAIARRVDAEAPLFSEDADKRKTASFLVAVAFRESSLRLGAIGDRGTSFCAFQISRSSGGTRAMLTDADMCVGHAFGMLRTSFRICRRAPLAWYAVGGTSACTNARAIRISNDRIALAARIRARVVVPDATEASVPDTQGFRTPIDAIWCCVSGRRYGMDERDERPCVGGDS